MTKCICGFVGNSHEIEVHMATKHYHCLDPECSICKSRPSTPVAAQGQPAANTDWVVGDAMPTGAVSSGYLRALDMKRSAEAAQGGTQETTKEQRLIDLENEVKYANAALGGNPAIQLCDRIRILKAGVAASQDTTKAKKEK